MAVVRNYIADHIPIARRHRIEHMLVVGFMTLIAVTVMFCYNLLSENISPLIVYPLGFVLLSALGFIWFNFTSYSWPWLVYRWKKLIRAPFVLGDYDTMERTGADEWCAANLSRNVTVIAYIDEVDLVRQAVFFGSKNDHLHFLLCWSEDFTRE